MKWLWRHCVINYIIDYWSFSNAGDRYPTVTKRDKIGKISLYNTIETTLRKETERGESRLPRQSKSKMAVTNPYLYRSICTSVIVSQLDVARILSQYNIIRDCIQNWRHSEATETRRQPWQRQRAYTQQWGVRARTRCARPVLRQSQSSVVPRPCCSENDQRPCW